MSRERHPAVDAQPGGERAQPSEVRLFLVAADDESLHARHVRIAASSTSTPFQA